MSSSTTPESLRGIHDRINRVSHWDVNVADLERSRAWYEATTQLRVVARTKSSQDFPGLGIASGAFTGYMMRDKSMPPGHPMIHLMEWQSPRPVGTPYLSHTNVGWYRIVPVVDDIYAARRSVIDAGSKPFTLPTETIIHLHPDWPVMDYRVFTTHDPDGIAVEFSQHNSHTGSTSMAPYTVAHNTSDVEKNIGFYLNVLGLDLQGCVQSPHLAPDVYSPIGGMTGFSGAFFSLRNDSNYILDWLQWTESPKFSKPYKEPNHVGIIRCVIEVDDVDAAYLSLKAGPQLSEYNFVIGEPETWGFGPEFGLRKVLNFQDPEGVGFQLIQQREVALQLHPFGRKAEFQE